MLIVAHALVAVDFCNLNIDLKGHGNELDNEIIPEINYR